MFTFSKVVTLQKVGKVYNWGLWRNCLFVLRFKWNFNTNHAIKNNTKYCKISIAKLKRQNLLQDFHCKIKMTKICTRFPLQNLVLLTVDIFAQITIWKNEFRKVENKLLFSKVQFPRSYRPILIFSWTKIDSFFPLKRSNIFSFFHTKKTLVTKI